MPKTIIYVAVVEHMSEMDVYTDVTEEGLERQVAAYCRGRWDTTSRAVSGCKRPPPDDNKACIDLYFEDHETDLLTTRVSSVEASLPDVQQLLVARYRKAFIDSLERAVDAAGGSPSWEDMKNMSLEEAAEVLGRNGVLFRAVEAPTGESSQALHLSVEAVVKSYPYLK